MDVRSFDGSRDAALWDAYVTSHPEATSDHLWGWRRVLADSFGFREAEYLGAVEEGRLVGVLPLYRIPAGWRRSALTSIPFGNYGGICADSPAAVEALLDEARRRLDRCRGVHLELRHRQPIAQPLLHQSTGTHSRFILPLGSDPDVHLRQVGWKNRQKINRAIRLGLQVESALDVGRLYPIHMHTARRQGVPCFPRRYFEGILREFGERVRILLILHQGRAVSFSLYLLFGDTMLSQFSGSYAEAYTYNPNELLFWAAIQQGCALGMKTFDFGCSRIVSGTADFKRHGYLRKHRRGGLTAGQKVTLTCDARSPCMPRMLTCAASCSATRRKALARSESGSVSTIGRPSSEAERMRVASGISPRKGKPMRSATARAPPEPKISSRLPQCKQE